MCDPFSPLKNVFGGGGKSSSNQSASQTATNTTAATTTSNVTVNVPVTTDTTPLAAAIDALRGSQATETAVSVAALSGALKSNASTLAAAIENQSGNSTDTQIFIGLLGLIGALIAAHVLRLPDIDL